MIVWVFADKLTVITVVSSQKSCCTTCICLQGGSPDQGSHGNPEGHSITCPANLRPRHRSASHHPGGLLHWGSRADRATVSTGTYTDTIRATIPDSGQCPAADYRQCRGQQQHREMENQQQMWEKRLGYTGSRLPPVYDINQMIINLNKKIAKLSQIG